MDVCDSDGYPGYADNRYKYESASPTNADGTSITPTERMQYVVLSRTRLQAESIKEIADIFPRMKILKIVECDLEQGEFRNNTIDITGIDHLEQLILNIAYIGNHSRRSVYIKVVSSIEDKVSCFMAEGGFEYGAMFRSIESGYIYDGRFGSLHSSIIVIKCQNWMKLSYLSVDISTER